MTASAPLRLSFQGAVAHLVLSRPEAANTIDLDLARRFRDAISEIARVGARAVIISGAGASFCAGGDVREMATAADRSALLTELAATFHDGLLALVELPAVIIAAVDGPAAGGGLGLALNADIILASERAVFLTAYESVGLTPDSGTSLLLPRAVGHARALAMTAAGVRLDAETAHRLGLVHQLVAVDDLVPTALTLAARLAERPQAHLPATRRLYRGTDAAGYRRHLDAEVAAIAAAAATPEAVSLIDRFAARPQTTGETA